MLIDFLEFFGLVFLLVIVFVGLSIKDVIDEKRNEESLKIHDFDGEVMKLTRRQAKELLGKDNVYGKLLKRSSHYFLYVDETNNWLTKATGIKRRTLLVTEKYDASNKRNINNLTRVLVYEESGKYNVRQTWCIGKVSNYYNMLKSVFDKERFKLLLDKYEDSGEMLDPFSIKRFLDNRMTFYNSIKSGGEETQIMLVTERIRYGERKKNVTTLGVVTAKPSYQVISSIALN